MIQRGEVWWADLAEPVGSEPGHRRPVVVVQADAFNRSRIDTTIVAVLTSNLGLVAAPGNVLVAAEQSGLKRDSVLNVSQLATVDRAALTERVGQVTGHSLAAIDEGLRLVLGLKRGTGQAA